MKKRLILIILALAVVIGASAYINPARPDWTEEQHKLHTIANMARGMGLPEDSPIIQEASRLWWEHQESYERDLQILACVVLNEAPYCTDRHQQLVAQVVLNRAASPLFPDTVEAVVNQPGQYNPAYTKSVPAPDSPDPEVQRAFANAKLAMAGGVKCPENVLYQSEFKSLGSGVYEEITVDTGWYRSTTYFNYG